MKNNQKYTQEEMYLAIELWKESGLSQQKYCRGNGIVYNTFKYWVKKYNGKKKPTKPQVKTFLPVQVKATTEDTKLQQFDKEITITYPNGIELRCSADIGINQLKALLNI
jgi:transposase-like protein